MQRKDRIRRHLDIGIDIALAEPLEIDRLAMPLDQEDGAGNLAGLRLIIEEVVDARELFRDRAAPGRGPKSEADSGAASAVKTAIRANSAK
jgi:hypothetical protein